MPLERILLTSSTWSIPALAAALGIWLVLMLLWRRPIVHGTTLMAPWWWALISVCAVAGCEVAVGLADGAAFSDVVSWARPLRLAAAATTFCPLMAALGAKRPQDRAWQFIVLAFWGILALPAAEAFFLGRGESFQLHDVRGWFLWVLILVGPANSLPTRFWFSGLLLAVAQTTLLAEHLPLLRTPLGGLPALAMAAVATTWAAAVVQRRRPSLAPADRLWIDFRDAFGALWALRVVERVNDAAKRYGWDISLSWHGFRTASGDARADNEIPPVVRQNLQNLLRRFVSPAWIAARLDSPVS